MVRSGRPGLFSGSRHFVACFWSFLKARSPRINRVASNSHRVNSRAQPAPTEIGTITRMSAIPIVARRCHSIFMKIAAAMTHQRPRASRVHISPARRGSKQLRRRLGRFARPRESGSLICPSPLRTPGPRADFLRARQSAPLRRPGKSLHQLDREGKHDRRAAFVGDIEQRAEIAQLHRLRHAG